VVQLLLAFINTPSSGCGEKDEKNREKTKRKRRRQREENKKKTEREKEKKKKKENPLVLPREEKCPPPSSKNQPLSFIVLAMLDTL
jgi:hypothetical protein